MQVQESPMNKMRFYVSRSINDLENHNAWFAQLSAGLTNVIMNEETLNVCADDKLIKTVYTAIQSDHSV